MTPNTAVGRKPSHRWTAALDSTPADAITNKHLNHTHSSLPGRIRAAAHGDAGEQQDREQHQQRQTDEATEEQP